MTDFFKKLNVLVRASVNDLIGDERSPGALRRAIQNSQVGKSAESDVRILRERINAALDYEEQLQQQVQAIRLEITQLDEQADAAVERGDEATARHFLGKIQRAQQRLTMAEVDLRDHQVVAEELIARVNELEAVLADSQYAQADDAPSTEDHDPVRHIHATERVSNVLGEMREKIAQMGDMLAAQAEVSPAPTEDDTDSPSSLQNNDIEDDLARRRDRLRKK